MQQSTLLFYLLLLEIFGTSPPAKTTALVTACLFAVHPIHTEAVASVVGRSELLAAGFLFAAWILHLRDLEIPRSDLLSVGAAARRNQLRNFL